MFSDKTVVLGVTGSIAVYKAVELASKLTQGGIAVDVVMTKAATEFVTPLAFRAITHRAVASDMFAPIAQPRPQHVALAERADVVVIAPATANTIAKLASGIADDLLSCTVLATTAPVILAPAMHAGMYENQITQENLKKLHSRGFTIVGPTYGRLVSGTRGLGRLAELDEISGTIYQVLGRTGDLVGRRILVSSGGTQEPIDLVRYIANRSSGKMGFAIAEAARNRGAKVVIISAPTALNPPVGVELIPVATALQMRDAVVEKAADADVLIMAAAVADYRPAAAIEGKIKRISETLSLELVKIPDIVSEVRDDIVKVGFAAETEQLAENAKGKLGEKGLDLIVANDITAPDSGFAVDTNKVIILSRNGDEEHLPVLPKSEVAHKILDKLVELLAAKP